MFEGLCQETVVSSWTPKIVVHCWDAPDHSGDHYDKDLNIYWRRGPRNVVSLGPARRMPWHRRSLRVA